MTITDYAARMVSWKPLLGPLIVMALLVMALLGCRGPGEGEQARPGQGLVATDPPEAFCQRSWARYQAVSARLSKQHPGLQPGHSVYVGLGEEVKQALFDLNSWSRDNAWVIENSPVYIRHNGKWVCRRDSGEGSGYISSRKERLHRLGVEVEWSNEFLLYQVVR